ncbi:class I SAM-dependent methyltransferase [Rufibacter immobilis]|uniref:Class I SAM-dependent methyltransferase n=1 Tax=Rufibacter immobilis TaxID=1348778 RepID=A0A3M9MSE0_9BACT|nr:class I SAM-dependent methyltransferase [Rufibacter immobilis]RNI28444.1 class I SAM-dependent methyltransferase [Rufibacter immobilis]
MIYRYASFWWRSGNAHGLHSPFVFNLYCHIIHHSGHFAAYDAVESLRDDLFQDHTVLDVTDFGAGSLAGATRKRKISDIAQTAAKPARLGQLLFRLANHFKPATILELGTSLGLTTGYLGLARKTAKLYTFEGCPAIAAQARKNLKKLGLENVQLVEGNLDQTLAQTLAALEKVDFVFFDGNHRYEPTLKYFEQCLTKAHEGSVFIFDDIYWSGEMTRAWKKIKQHPQVLLTVDLFYMGLVFFRTNQPKQHFTLRF